MWRVPVVRSRREKLKPGTCGRRRWRDVKGGTTSASDDDNEVVLFIDVENVFLCFYVCIKHVLIFFIRACFLFSRTCKIKPVSLCHISLLPSFIALFSRILTGFAVVFSVFCNVRHYHQFSAYKQLCYNWTILTTVTEEYCQQLAYWQWSTTLMFLLCLSCFFFILL